MLPKLSEIFSDLITLQKSAQEKTVELFDQKCLIKLNEVATSLIKLAPYDGDTMSCTGLAAYITHVFPNTDWSQVSLSSLSPHLHSPNISLLLFQGRYEASPH